MVPILTSVVLGQGTHSQARLLSFWALCAGHVLAYAGAGVAIGLLGAGANIQALATDPWVLVLLRCSLYFWHCLCLACMSCACRRA